MTITERALGTIRLGRKRKMGKRHPNGELVAARKQKEDAQLLAFQQPHRRSVSESKRFDQKAGTSLGRLNLRGIITDEQFEAGRKYGATVAIYRASIEAPRVGESIAGIGQPDGRNPISFEAAREIRQRYDDVFEIFTKADRPSLKALNRVAVHDEECPHWLTDLLICALDKLSDFYGLTRGGKSANS